MSEVKKYYDMGLDKVRTFSVKYVGPTNTLGARIAICDEWEKDNKHDRRRHKFFYSYDYSLGCIVTQAINILISAGFNIISYSEMVKCYHIHVDSHEYKDLKEVK